MELSPLVSNTQAVRNTTEITPDPPVRQQTSAESQTLQIDFLWSKGKARITRKGDPDATPIYMVECKRWYKSKIIFKSLPDNSIIGTGIPHAISISPSCVVHDHPITLQALKSLKTSYTHLSPAFSVDGIEPMPMTWTSTANFKTWDFVCLDVNQIPVARFSARWWAIKKFAYIEFLGEHELSEAVRDEIVIMGTMLYFGMVVRINNPLNLVGSVLHTTGSSDKKNL